MAANKHAAQLGRQFFKLGLENGQITAERVAAVLQYLEKHPPRHGLAVLKAYYRLVRNELAKSHATVEYAGSLSDSVLQQLARLLSTKYNRQISAAAKPNPDLIAGLRIRIGDNIFESSIAGQLEALAASV